MDNKYDVVIIGAGIGGLVCGCYLAKAGLKVLIVEQQNKPGGYCTSFERDGFRFDVGVHYLGSLREEGILFKILNELELLNKIEFIRGDPTDKIIIPDKTILIRKESQKTKEELIIHFPKEKDNINKFFDFIINNSFLYIASKTKRIKFNALLNSLFNDYKLKAILSIPIGSIGLPPSRASALASCVLFKEYILDGGYYPKGGMQEFPDLLVNKLKESGGKIIFSRKIDRIITKNHKAIGVNLNETNFLQTKYVVSNTDATLTFGRLLDCSCIENKKIKKLRVSPSAFVIYLGLNSKLSSILSQCCATWVFNTHNIDKCYSQNNIWEPKRKNIDYLFYNMPTLLDATLAPSGKDILRIFIGCDYKKGEIDKEKIYEKIMLEVTKMIPEINNLIDIKILASPSTFFRYTGNKNGALFGWQATPNQIERKVFPYYTTIENLFLAGHWVTNGIGQSGVAMVAYSGMNTAKEIIKKYGVSK